MQHLLYVVHQRLYSSLSSLKTINIRRIKQCLLESQLSEQLLKTCPIQQSTQTVLFVLMWLILCSAIQQFAAQSPDYLLTLLRCARACDHQSLFSFTLCANFRKQVAWIPSSFTGLKKAWAVVTAYAWLSWQASNNHRA